MDAKKGEVHIEDGKVKPEPIKKFHCMVRRYMIGWLKKLKDIVDPNYWMIGNKSGLYDKARNSSTRQWVDSLTGEVAISNRWWFTILYSGRVIT